MTNYNRPKEAALDDFRGFIMRSWTYERLTDAEREKLAEFLNGPRAYCVSGSYKNRWSILLAIYGAFLDGCGYSGPNWRDDEMQTLKAANF